MATIQDIYNSWCIEEVRGASQMNEDVWLAWFNKGLLIFQKMILEYVSGIQNTSHVFQDIVKDQDEYLLPLGEAGKPDFYSIIQLRVAYHTDKLDNPLYRVCQPMNFGDYNLRPMINQYDENGKLIQQGGQKIGEPYIWENVSEINPRYVFVNKNHIKIFPTPTEDITNGLTLTYNFIEKAVTNMNTNTSTLNLPWYFFDAIEDYLTFRLYQAENPEQAQWYYQQFENTLHDNIYGLNKDKRPVEEGLANTSYFSHY